MYAVFEHNDKQYKVSKGDYIKLPRQVGLKKEDSIKFDKILFIKSENGDLQVGSPLVTGSSVEATVIEQIRDKKIIVFKKKRRHNYRRKIGHRQDLTLIKITNIFTNKSQKTENDKVTEKTKITKEDKNGS
ncbi:MAG: 50S ribosomal protein L21 [Alphaproteobacteria bacterium]|jgi:large subunit ribosomal protein L21|nr:50S ribosomal protein L21 [Alphaproteobacteria bacterium]|tara:strand:- start:1213 stop:1605 length:393 start_codon:yes stop_codon:yes gene_type:complete